MCEGLSKISSNFTLHLIKVGKLKQFKKVPSDLKTILKTHLAILGFLSFKKGRGRTVAFFFMSRHMLSHKYVTTFTPRESWRSHVWDINDI